MRSDVSILVVTGLPRSGTTFVDRALAALPGVLALGEPFHASPELRAAQHPGLQAWRNGECPRRWLRGVDHQGKVLTLKLLSGQLPPADITDVVRLGHTIVCERHPLASLVSLKQAIASDVWNRLSENGRDLFGRPITEEALANAARPVPLEKIEIERHLVRYHQHERRCERLTWRIPFSAIVEHPGQVCQWLGQWLSVDSPRAATERLHPEPLPTRVANWDEVRRWFSLPEYRHLEEW